MIHQWVRPVMSIPIQQVPPSKENVVDESNTSLLFLGLIGGLLGLTGGLVAFFFGSVLWNNIEEVPDEGDEGETTS